ncbi:hypothetical protein [Paraburkholderia elongata]|uniref:hypothetical protein n=1 Tax=Paraburkholderia elongata TaxID=2675747 RepID=UPI0038B30FD2
MNSTVENRFLGIALGFDVTVIVLPSSLAMQAAGYRSPVLEIALRTAIHHGRSTTRMRPFAARRTRQEYEVKRTAENQRKVVAVRVNPQIEQRLRLLAELTGRRQSFFLQQMIEGGIGAMEDTWLPPDVLSRVRSGTMPSRQQASDAISDLFGSSLPDQAS